MVNTQNTRVSRRSHPRPGSAAGGGEEKEMVEVEKRDARLREEG